jgi:two-component system chemotaxis sensor kinase CheA
MDIERLETLVESLNGALIFADEGADVSTWKEFLTTAEEILKESQGGDCPVVADAASAGVKLFSGLVDGVFSDVATVCPHLFKIGEVLGESVADLARPAANRRSFKSELAAVRVFLGDVSAASESVDSMDDADEDAEFLQDMLHRVDGVEARLLAARDEENALAAFTDIFREFHTLKGETGILGMNDLNKFFHAVESALEPARHQALVLTDELVASLMAVVDVSRSLLKQESETGEQTSQIVTALSSAVTSAPLGGEVADAAFADADDDDDDFFADAAESDDDLFDEDDDMGLTDEEDESNGEDIDLNDTEEAVQAIAGAVAEEVEEEAVPENESLAVIPIDVRRIDRMLEQVASLNAEVLQLARNGDLKPLLGSRVGAELTAVTRTAEMLQNTAIGFRMMPIAPLFKRMKRVAFDVGRARQRRVAVRTEGLDTEVDRTIIENLTGAMVHLIRNAIDHGIEPAAQRRAKGKNERGRIILRAYRDAGEVVIEMSDDGCGIDAAKIRQKAESLGLIKPEDDLTDQQILEFIFHPGFSTAQQVTGVSGRGVGMEAVRAAVEELRGKLRVDSTPGRGTTMQIILPLSLSAMEGLVIRVGQSHYILPAHVVRESFRPEEESLSTVEGKGQVVSVRGTVIPVVHLGQVLEVPYDADDAAEAILVIVSYQERMAALLCDAVVATQAAMVRPLEGGLSKLDCVSGAVSLGQGQLALVLEVRELLKFGTTAGSSAMATGFGDRDRIETVDVGSNQVAMVDFSIRHEVGGKEMMSRFAINAFKAREFVPWRPLTAVPHAPKGFSGMLLLRDLTIPVVNLSSVLGFNTVDSREDHSIVICEFGGHTIGIEVSQVNRVNYISWGEIKPPPDTGALVKDQYVVGTILMGEDVVFVLDFEQLVQMVLTIYREFGTVLEGVQQRKHGSRVLLAEDSALVRAKATEALTAAGMEVVPVGNGKEAWDELQEMAAVIEKEGGSIFDLVDVILSDIEMPQMDGYTLCQQVKSHPVLLPLPLIFFSSLTNETVIKRAHEVKADGVVAKGDPERLALLLRQYL